MYMDQEHPDTFFVVIGRKYAYKLMQGSSNDRIKLISAADFTGVLDEIDSKEIGAILDFQLVGTNYGFISVEGKAKFEYKLTIVTFTINRYEKATKNTVKAIVFAQKTVKTRKMVWKNYLSSRINGYANIFCMNGSDNLHRFSLSQNLIGNINIISERTYIQNDHPIWRFDVLDNTLVISNYMSEKFRNTI